MSKRLEVLEKMVASGKADAFARYALAMEYRKLGRSPEALAAFEALRETDSGYLAQYLMAGQLLLELNRPDEARLWLEQGIGVAKQQGNSQALGELESALSDAITAATT